MYPGIKRHQMESLLGYPFLLGREVLGVLLDIALIVLIGHQEIRSK
mgnify:CR=1 FL=1